MTALGHLFSPFDTRITVRLAAKLSLGLGLSAVLVGVFTLYTQPDFLVMLANQVWACF